jgi:hypothetical protein
MYMTLIELSLCLYLRFDTLQMPVLRIVTLFAVFRK